MIDFKLMPHQEDILHQSSHKHDLFLAWGLGTGKTNATIQILRRWYADSGRLRKTLILAPLITLQNWQDEFEKFSNIPKKSVYALTKASKRAGILELLGSMPAIVIMNYDGLSQERVFKAIQAWNPDYIVYDEVHQCKNHKSKRAKAAAEISDNAQRRILLTGTPILNTSLDLFMQFRILDGYKGVNSTFGKNFFVFRNIYFMDSNAGWSNNANHFPNWVQRPAAASRLQRILADKMSIIKKEDVLKDLPPLVRVDRHVTMSIEQAKAYKEMKRDFVSYIKGLTVKGEPAAIVAKLAITKAIRLQQIVSGAVNLDDGGGYHIFAKNPRLDALRELLSDIAVDNKVIVWACFKANYTMIGELCEELNLGHTFIHGEIKNEDKYKNMKSFNEDPACRVLIGNPGSGGIGVNLVSASYSIYYSRGTKLGDDLQSEARNHRKGSEIHDKITRINLVCPGTIDETIDKALSGKLDMAEAILGKGGV